MTKELPQRIQRKRTKGWRMPSNAVYVGRGSKWGNPFKIGEPFDAAFSRIQGNVAFFEKMHEFSKNLIGDLNARGVVAAYEIYLDYVGLPSGAIEYLRGKHLVCWCKHGEPCHADVLIERANND